ncbi:MAG TPA: HAMP domain-containing sensor histidine kinase [Planctomycetota bacterium]|nr:HAMP domain-containing sensor histidine kinase [Planctomycetota bacterium]
MRHPWQIWIAFALSLLVGLGAMGWITWTAMQLDEAQERAHGEADLEENVRLSLWRMDSSLTPLIAQESMRPYFVYRSFYPTEQMFACTPEGATRNEDLLPSPILLEIPQHVVLHFQFDPEGRLSSPQAPTGEDRQRARNGLVSEQGLDTGTARLTEFQSHISWEGLISALAHDRPRVAGGAIQPLASSRSAQQRVQLPAQRGAQAAEAQTLRNSNEWSARQGINLAAVRQYGQTERLFPAYDAKEALMKAVWSGNVLVLARRVTYLGQEYIQGCWIDWPELRGWLLESIQDLLPAAELEPARPGQDSGEKGARLLAGLPVLLVPGQVELQAVSLPSPLRISLVAAWVCGILAACAVAILLLGVLSLSERRAAFVSAVTHELRTPLTTFRMYSELLSRGMVPDEQKRRHYLGTLCREADRLSHLVENVLAFARLERRGADGARIGDVGVEEIFDRIEDRLRDRAEQAGLHLVHEPTTSPAPIRVRADPAAVEQILFNLVDNACKYAHPTTDPRLHISAEGSNGRAYIRVLDHGPGIARPAARRLFRAFSKSAADAAHSAPGVGLGLALSRRLARSMGGDLRLDDSNGGGACFLLVLPAA